jgi:hypothetical protein
VEVAQPERENPRQGHSAAERPDRRVSAQRIEDATLVSMQTCAASSKLVLPLLATVGILIALPVDQIGLIGGLGHS